MSNPVARGVLNGVQLDASDRLQSLPYFADVKILHEQVQDLANEMERALAVLEGTGGRNGICAVVLTPKASTSKPNMPGPYLDSVRIVIRVIESVLVNQGDNGTGKPAAEVAEQIAASLHLWQKNSNTKLIVFESLGLVPDENLLLYDVIFSTQAGIQPIT